MKLIFGLGNPGLEYEKTIHNLGFLVLDKLAEKLNVSINQKGCHALRKEIKVGKSSIVLIKPQTYMNNSGMAVRELAARYKVKVENIFVVSDDIELRFGEIRIRRKGRYGGHLGLRSIINDLGSRSFPRMKIGAGPVEHCECAASYVLKKINRGAWKNYEKIIDYASCALEDIIKEGIDMAMQRYNGKALGF